MLASLTLALALIAPQALPAKAEGTLRTRWAGQVGSVPHPEYPRPQMARKAWTNLNGKWDLQIRDEAKREVWKGRILVPFPVESQLSGVQQRVPQGGTLIYRRRFDRPKGDRVLLHFGAVDWHAKVTVNGKPLGEHRGGYDPFTFDVTAHLKPTANDLVVEVQDPTDRGTQPRGKQVEKPEGIFYTPTSGIWQTVWLEPVPKLSVAALDVLAEMDGTLRVGIDGRLAPGSSRPRAFFTVVLKDGSTVRRAQAAFGDEAVIKVPKPRLWAPGQPNLYPITVRFGDDSVTSYVGFRNVRIGTAKNQVRILVNEKPVFLAGLLDQGFWPDGLYTPPTDEALKYDIDVTKRLGFNTIRKHVKVEPARFYYWCDKMGIAVQQDMPSMSGFIGGSDPDLKVLPEVRSQYLRELTAMIEGLRNHPSILMWVPFNEGWGQHETEATVNYVKSLDSSRLVNNASGWTDRRVGDVHDIHVYPGPASPQPEANRAQMLGEFGGLGLPVPKNAWRSTGWGYQSFKTHEELTARFVEIFDGLRFLIGAGLSSAIYTQTTDVETEINGLLSYDRELIKMDEKQVREAVLKLYKPAPQLRTVLPTSEAGPQTWEFRTSESDPFVSAPGGFGSRGTPGSVVRTDWTSPNIWIRREFSVDRAMEVRLRIHHDEDAEVYLDGNLVRSLSGYTSTYIIDTKTIRLAPGKHTLLVKVKQTRGGQYIDAGLVEVLEARG